MCPTQCWQDPSFLSQGDERQQEAFRVLKTLGLWEILRDFRPTLAGSIPLGVAIDGSDLDILCESADLSTFEKLATLSFGGHTDFQVQEKSWGDGPAVTVTFSFQGLCVEIIVQSIRLVDQVTCRRLLIADRLLRIGGDAARREVIRLKKAGMKTEPALIRFFRLEGSSYPTLLHLEPLTEEGLESLVLPRITPSE